MSEWFYSCHNKQEGPVNQEALMTLANAKLFNSNTLVWKYGMQDWQFIGEVPELANVNSIISNSSAEIKPPVTHIQVAASHPNHSLGHTMGFFNEPFTSKGRLRRLHYDLRMIVYILGFTLLEIFILFMDIPGFASFINLFWIPFSIYLHFIWHIRRFHDMNKSGHFAWLLFVPFFNVYLLFTLWFSEGTIGPNTYGADPKGRK